MPSPKIVGPPGASFVPLANPAIAWAIINPVFIPAKTLLVVIKAAPATTDAPNVGIAAAVLFLSLKKKIGQNIAIIILGLVSLLDLWSVNKRYLNNDNFIDKTFTENPFQTENSELLMQKVGDNKNLQSLLANANINKTLETIAEKDKTHYRIYNQVLGTFSETNTSYFKASIGGYHAVKLRRYDDLINEYFGKMDSVKVPRILNMLI